MVEQSCHDQSGLILRTSSANYLLQDSCPTSTRGEPPSGAALPIYFFSRREPRTAIVGGPCNRLGKPVNRQLSTTISASLQRPGHLA